MAELTPWFSAYVKPVNAGMYEVRAYDGSRLNGGDYATWCPVAGWSYSHKKSEAPEWDQFSLPNKRWRGLTQPREKVEG